MPTKPAAKPAKNPNRVKAGRSAKRKGNSNERKLAKQFKEWWGHGEWAKTPSSGGWATKEVREDFRTCGDIITTAEDFPFCVEAKHQENWELLQLLSNANSPIYKFWAQTVEETPEPFIPLLIIRRNRREPVVIARSCDILFTVKDNGRQHMKLQREEGDELTILLLKDFFDIGSEQFGSVAREI